MLRVLAILLLIGKAASAAEPFVVFEELLQKDKPDLIEQGLQPIDVVYNDAFPKGTSRSEAVTSNVIRKLVSRNPDQMLVYDIEHWPWDERRASREEVAATMDKLVLTAKRTRSIRSDARIGFYMLPLRDYWTPVKYASAIKRPEGAPQRAKLPELEKEIDRWQNANARIREKIAPHVDAVFPSLYTFYDASTSDRDQWVTYAKANIAEAKKFGKPVYPFLWFEYHDSNKKLKGKPVAGDFWRLQLETCREAGADGVVIWGGWKRKWDDKAEWWLETKDFVNELRDP